MKYYLLAIDQAIEDLGLCPVAHADFDGALLTAFLRRRGGDFDRRVSRRVINDGALRYDQRAFALFEYDLGIGRHIGPELAPVVTQYEMHGVEALGLLKMGWISHFLSGAVLAGFVFGFGFGLIVDQTPKILGLP